MSGYWPWWLGGVALATLALGFWLATGRLLGVSGNFANLLRRRGGELDQVDDAALEAALLAATREQFGAAAEPSSAEPEPASSGLFGPRTRWPWSAHATFLAAVVLGGTLGALTRGTFGVRFDLGAEYARLIGGGWRSWTALAGGGLLVGFGTAMAGGCTSGHGLCGTARFQIGSLVATASFFGAAVAVSLLLAMVAT